MADLTPLERRKLERLLRMGSGYVLDFSNKTFDQFVFEAVGRTIYDDKYAVEGTSKANRLRAFWKLESGATVGRLLNALIDVASDCLRPGDLLPPEEATRLADCQAIAARLLQGGQVVEIDALQAPTDDRDFEIVARAAREAVERNELIQGLDRLHTFVVKFVRAMCEKRGITAGRDKALPAIFGEYVRKLREAGEIETVMTERILKSSISVLEAFNDVRNNRSLAHDNPLLSYDEALLIINHVTGAVRFVRGVEARRPRPKPPAATSADALDDIPF
jgi:hypothetical protein